MAMSAMLERKAIPDSHRRDAQARDAGRNPLPRTTDAPITSESPGVAPISTTKRIPIYPAVIRVGGTPWSFSGLEGDIFGSPYGKDIRGGYISREVRQQMDLHPNVSQSFHNLKNGIIGDGGRCIPCVPPSHPDFEAARKVSDFCDFALRQSDGYHQQIAAEMLDCIRDGNKVAAIALKDWSNPGKWQNKRVFDQLTVLPEGTYAFYRDETARTTYLQLFNGYPNPTPFYVPRAKFWLATWRMRDNNPYGHSSYLAAYLPFYRDVHTDSEEMAYMAQAGRPSVVILAAPPIEKGLEEETFPLRDIEGNYLYEPNPDFDPELPTTPNPTSSDDPSANPLERIRYGYMVEQNAILFTNFKAGSVWSLEAGSTVEVKQMASGGADLFRFLREANAKQMAAAIYGTYQVTETEGSMTAQNQDIAEGVAGLTVQYGKLLLEKTEEDDLLRLAVVHNFGPAYEELLPIRDYGSGMNSRLPKVFNSVVGFLTNGAMDRDQWWWFCAANGFPLPYPDVDKVVVNVGGTGGGDKTGNPPAGNPSNQPASN